MTATLKGTDELKRRFKAIRTKVAGPAARAWQTDAVSIARGKVGAMQMPYAKGVLLNSIDAKRTATGRVGATTTKAVVVGSYHAYFVDSGVRQHSIARGAKHSRTIFASASRKHPGYKARPFRVATATEAYRRNPVGEFVIKAWNGAA